MKRLIFTFLSSLLIIFACIGIDFSINELELWKKSDLIRTWVYTHQLESLIKQMNSATDAKERLNLAIAATEYANNHETLYLSSDEIETVFTDIAKLHSTELSKDVIPNSVCHIATELHDIGGHSRVIERWIETAPDNEKHFLIVSKNYVPNRLQKAIEDKNGEIFYLPENMPDIEKAMFLRQLASQFEHIVLHIHMNDYLPLIAFGTNEFKRPILFFNHADHRFWLGVSIADNIIHFRSYGQRLTEQYRGSTLTSLSSLPFDNHIHNHSYNKQKNRELLGLPQNRKIIFSSGSAYKFIPEGDLDYSLFMHKIFQHKKDIFFVLVGPTPNLFHHLSSVPKENYKFYPVIPNDEYIKYLSTADVVVDSFPMGGGLALADALSINIPVVSLKSKYLQTDFIMQTKAYKQTMEELVETVLKILASDQTAKEYLEDGKATMDQENLKILNTIKNLYHTITTHTVHPFKSIKQSYKEILKRT